MVFKTRHFTTLAVILGIILGLSAWSLPSYAQMRHGRGGMAGGPVARMMITSRQDSHLF